MIFKRFCLFVFAIGTTLNAQKPIESESVIRMSEDDLTSLVSKIVEARKVRMQQENFDQYETRATNNNASVTSSSSNSTFETDYLTQKIEELKKQVVLSKQKTVTEKYPSTSGSGNLYVRRDIEDLEYKINEMRALLIAKNEQKPSEVVVKTEIPNKEIQNPLVSDTQSQAYQQKLQSQIDSLYLMTKVKSTSTSTSEPTDYSGDFSNIEKKLLDLQNELNQKNNQPTNYDLLSNTYKGYKKTIFFDNNSKTISITQNTVIDELVTILNSNNNVDVLVKGFASKKGNPIYNQNLSLQRTEAIKAALISKGIHPTRVLTIYYGVDYGASTEAESRRVDMSMVIRK